MEILRTRNELQAFVKAERDNGRIIGLVPTMGALHKGHISLIYKAMAEGDSAIASLFVNPTQFNNPADLATYPRSESEDFELLRKAGASAVFAPSVEEVYPEGFDSVPHEFQLGHVAEVMEGKFRPGHFQGVAQIVNLLLTLVAPDKAYFGEKDFQQIAVIRQMVRTEGLPIEIVACPIIREEDGLAMSSRNKLLTTEQRLVAPGIYAILREGVERSEKLSVDETKSLVINRVNELPECSVEYFEIVHPDTLDAIADWKDAPSGAQGCITVYCGKVRLIDNIFFPTFSH